MFSFSKASTEPSPATPLLPAQEKLPLGTNRFFSRFVLVSQVLVVVALGYKGDLKVSEGDEQRRAARESFLLNVGGLPLGTTTTCSAFRS